MKVVEMQAERKLLREEGSEDFREKLHLLIIRREKSVRKNLADGPGKLCIAMEISKKDNDLDMVESNTFYVTEGIEVMPEEIREGKRIGIDYAEEAADYLWRFYLE